MIAETLKRCQTPFLRCLTPFLLFAVPVRAEIPLDNAFWENYQPYRQYSETMLRDLSALEESDLLATGRNIDRLELRIVGRKSPLSNLISVRAVIDDQTGQRLQVKIVPDIVRNDTGKTEVHRRPLSAEQAQRLTAMLEQWQFWEAPYQPADDADCEGSGHWIIEGIRPGGYQLIERSECAELEPGAAETRDYLLGIAGITR